MTTKDDYLICDVERVKLNGKNRTSFKAYEKDATGGFVFAGVFYANISVKKQDLWKVAVAEIARRES